MTKIRIKQIAGVAAGTALAFGTFVPMVGAQTIAELQEQINVLMAQLAALQGGTTMTTDCTFTGNLTVGSRGTEVVCLQDYLTGTGHFTYSGGSTGYFGPITQAAVAAWQAANDVAPAVGYFGPISQAKYTAIAGTTVPGGTTPGAGITTPGVEGILTATLNPSPASGTKVYEGGEKKAVMGLKLEAKLSDISVQRVKIQLSAGTSGNSAQQFYNKVADRMYVMDGSTVLASVDLNSSTVVKEGSNYYITITGFSFIVSKDTTKVLTIAIDPKTSWDSTYDGDSWTMTVPSNGIRGVDGAGINQYSPTSALTGHNWVSTADILDSAALTVSLASDSPDTSQVIANEGSSSDEKDDLVLAKVNFKADDDNVKVTDLVADITRGGGNNVATATTAYIYDGSTLVGSATVVGTSATAMTATFSNIDWVVPADTTRTLTLKVDIDSAAVAADTFVGGVGNVLAVATAVSSENSAGSSITETGSATGRTITVRSLGPEISLVSKSITSNGVPQTGGSPVSTSTLTATFNVKIKAVGATLNLGTVASGTPVIASSTASFKIFRNGAYDGTISSVSTSTSYSIGSGCTSTGTNSCNLTDGNEVTIQATFQILGRDVDGVGLTSGLYSVQFTGITWHGPGGASQVTNFMAADNDWRTSDVSFP